jgi:hypothetical protein
MRKILAMTVMLAGLGALGGCADYYGYGYGPDYYSYGYYSPYYNSPYYFRRPYYRRYSYGRPYHYARPYYSHPYARSPSVRVAPPPAHHR